ncbi:MAG: hypothetical protein LC750_16700 [Actinobacteria bacterium]|nr:hypothetical protein [Actinomycetota bacterium]
MAEFGGGGVLGGLAGIVTGIANAVKAFAGVTAQQLLNYLKFLREHLLELSREVYKGIKETAKALARNVRALARGIRDGVLQLAIWAKRAYETIHDFLVAKLGPVLRFIEKIRKRIDEIYTKYVRPVLDVIDFIRQLNRVLEVFHIHVLSALDATLAQVERFVNEQFLWVRQQITRIDNFLDRVIGLDGLVQRGTLIASLSRYRGSWFAGFWNGQIDGGAIALKRAALPPIADAEDPAAGGAELGRFYQGQSSDLDDALPELLELFRDASGAGA